MFILFFALTIALLCLFSLVGVIISVGAVRSARRRRAGDEAGPEQVPSSFRERIQRYVGPVKPRMALLNPAARVGIEFFSGCCGFPGFGWMLATRTFVGLVMLSVVPSFVWAIVPALMAANGYIYRGPFQAVTYLPALGFLSAAALAASEISQRRHDKGKRST